MADDLTNVMLVKALDFAAQRHRVLANNLANVNTPGFRRQELSFEEEFAEALKSGPEALKSLQAQVRVDATAPARIDGNSVQLEQEMSEMSQNALKYQMVLQMLGMRMAMERTAITGR